MWKFSFFLQKSSSKNTYCDNRHCEKRHGWTSACQISLEKTQKLLSLVTLAYSNCKFLWKKKGAQKRLHFCCMFIWWKMNESFLVNFHKLLLRGGFTSAFLNVCLVQLNQTLLHFPPWCSLCKSESSNCFQLGKSPECDCCFQKQSPVPSCTIHYTGPRPL